MPAGVIKEGGVVKKTHTYIILYIPHLFIYLHDPNNYFMIGCCINFEKYKKLERSEKFLKIPPFVGNHSVCTLLCSMQFSGTQKGVQVCTSGVWASSGVRVIAVAHRSPVRAQSHGPQYW